MSEHHDYDSANARAMKLLSAGKMQSDGLDAQSYVVRRNQPSGIGDRLTWIIARDLGAATHCLQCDVDAKALNTMTAGDVERNIEPLIDRILANGSKVASHWWQRIGCRLNLPQARQQVRAWLIEAATHDDSWYQAQLQSVADSHWSNFIPDIKRSGCGIVTLGGGKYWKSILVQMRMLRESGSTLPVEIWYRSGVESVFPQNLDSLGPVTLRDVNTVVKSAHYKWPVGGWDAKLWAISHTNFKRLFFLDADAYFVRDPTTLITERHDAPFVYWEDRPTQKNRINWPAVWPKTSRTVPPVQGGHLLIDMERAQQLVGVVSWINRHHHYYYRHMFGDQDTWRLALEAIGLDSLWQARQVVRYVHGVFIVDDQGEPLIVHRINSKLFDEPGRRVWDGSVNASIPKDDRLAEHMTNLDGRPTHRENRVVKAKTTDSHTSAAQQKRRTREKRPEARFTFEPNPYWSSKIRHLTYHVWPTVKHDGWKWNLDQLSSRWRLFNGTKILAVVTDQKTVRGVDVTDFARSRGMHFDHVIEMPNDRKLREAATWVPMLERLNPETASDSEVVFSAHAKGVRHAEHTSTLMNWARIMYEACLDDWLCVEDQLSKYLATGCFKRYNDFRTPGNDCWHYSGTFFWWRLAELGKRDWRKIDKEFFGTESWLGLHCKHEETGCLFLDEAGNLYDADYMQGTVLKEWGERCNLRSVAANISHAGMDGSISTSGLVQTSATT